MALGRAEKWERVRSEIHRVARELGVPIERLSRREYLEHSRIGWVGAKAFGGWGGMRAMAAAEVGAGGPVVPQGTAHPVDVSGLDWDDSEGDTAPQLVPLAAIPDGHHVRGISTLVGPDGEIKAQWVKTAREQEDRARLLERLLTELPAKVPERIGVVPRPSGPFADDVLAVYPMGDPHIGMLSWAPETGTNWDLARGTAILRDAFDSLVSQGLPARRALLCELGDFFHADNDTNRTPRGKVHLDVDGRRGKILRAGLDVMVYGIDRLLSVHDEVEVDIQIGNHDPESALFLSVALDHHYRQEPRVQVNCDPSAFHYYRHGKCLVGVCHGHTTKHQNLEAIMASDRPQDWGETMHRFWYVGHVHHTRRVEYRGCTVETFRTLAPGDAWHVASGYRSGRDMNRISLHAEYGEVGRATVSAGYLASQVVA